MRSDLEDGPLGRFEDIYCMRQPDSGSPNELKSHLPLGLRFRIGLELLSLLIRIPLLLDIFMSRPKEKGKSSKVAAPEVRREDTNAITETASLFPSPLGQ